MLQFMRDEIKTFMSISNSAVKTTDLSLLMSCRWKKQDMVNCFTWVSNNEVDQILPLSYAGWSGSSGQRANALNNHGCKLAGATTRMSVLSDLKLRIFCQPVPDSIYTVKGA